MEDYIDFVLGRNQPKADASAKGGGQARAKAAPPDKAATQAAWQARRELGKQIAKAEKDMAKLQARIAEVDTALADPAKAPKPLAGMNLGALGKLRAS
jgi:ATP-binding cassette subfamily F protein 3